MTLRPRRRLVFALGLWTAWCGAGNVCVYGAEHEFDGANRMAHLHTDDGHVVQLAYDGEGGLVGDCTLVAATGERRCRDLVMDRVASGLPSVVAVIEDDLVSRIVHTPSGPQQAPSGTSPSHPVIDELGSARGAVGPSGRIPRHHWDAWGEPRTTTAGEEHFGFTGEWSIASGPYLWLRARVYRPGFFVQRDTIAGSPMIPTSMNRYGYVEGAPTTGVDPLGNYRWSINGGHRELLTVGAGRSRQQVEVEDVFGGYFRKMGCERKERAMQQLRQCQQRLDAVGGVSSRQQRRMAIKDGFYRSRAHRDWARVAAARTGLGDAEFWMNVQAYGGVAGNGPTPAPPCALPWMSRADQVAACAQLGSPGLPVHQARSQSDVYQALPEAYLNTSNLGMYALGHDTDFLVGACFGVGPLGVLAEVDPEELKAQGNLDGFGTVGLTHAQHAAGRAVGGRTRTAPGMPPPVRNAPLYTGLGAPGLTPSRSLRVGPPR